MADVQTVLDQARSQLLYSENPAGSNRTKFGAWYGLDGNPWCDMFVSWCGAMAGAGAVVGRFASTIAHIAWFKARGQFHTTGPVPGDCVFFNWGGRPRGVPEHIGFVEAVRSDGVVTLEGNTSSGNNANGGQVQRRFRPFGSYIVGYGRPSYTSPKLTKVQLLYWWLWAGAQAARKPFLRPGSEVMPGNTAHIKDVQKAFGLTQTGTYGPATVAKVEAFQEYLRIPHRGPAGRMNRRTWQWLIYDVFTRGRR